MFHSLRRPHRAVAIIFFVLVFGLSLSFSMVVLNTGLIVYNKMKLQSSVDLAAYAGASVQASYLGNESSGADSISAINDRIIRRYIQLLEDINEQPNRVVPMVPFGFPDPGSCMAACVGANVAVASRAEQIYRRAISDIEAEHEQARRILEQMPAAVRKAMEVTLALNIPDLSLEEGVFGGATNNLDEIIDEPLGNLTGEPRHASLAFTSEQGMYLANVVAGVPHRMVYFGPSCANINRGQSAPPMFYCTVNGAGATGTNAGFAAAMGALARGLHGGEASGNVGHIPRISRADSDAIKLHFIEDPHKPGPFVVAAAEWFPTTGHFMNLEKTFGARGQLIPRHTRLGAVAGAEPFGALLATQEFRPFGVRLQAIRKLLLDPRMGDVRDHFGGLYDYMEYIGPRDERGNPIESVDDTIRRFLH